MTGRGCCYREGRKKRDTREREFVPSLSPTYYFFSPIRCGFFMLSLSPVAFSFFLRFNFIK